MIPRETIERVFAAAKIEEVVGDYVNLKRRGANLIGLCPFHEEKTGSFTVSPSKGIFKCFGCGKAGHAVGFIMEIEQCSYYDAIRQLAKRYHIEIEDRELTAEEQQRQDDRESMFVVNDFANRWFQDQLWQTSEGKAVAMEYLRERGLREDIIRKFQIGYSPERANLWKAAKDAGYSDRYLINDAENAPHVGTGVCIKSEDGRLFDRFRGRIIFPFFSVSGRVVGFAGRLLKKNDKAGKYVNSPTSLLFEKHNELFGLYQARQAISKQNCCYLVEGQIDVIQMAQSGFENVVASGGTSLTTQQVRLLHRYTENIIVLYDGDKAGIKAAIRGIDMLLEEDMNVKVVLLPDGEDPDSYTRKHNADEVLSFIQSEQTDFIRFKTRLLLSQETGDDPNQRKEAINQVAQSIAIIPDIIKRRVYIQDCAPFLSIPENELADKVREVRTKRTKQGTTGTTKEEPLTASSTEVAEDDGLSVKEKNVLNLIQVIVRYGERVLQVSDDGTPCQAGEFIINELRNDNIEISPPPYQRIIDEYMAHYREPAFVASTFFLHHPDIAISQLAIQLVEDRYQLSTIYGKKSISENVQQEVAVETDADRLPELINRLLLELKYTVVNEHIDTMQSMLQEAQDSNNWELIRTILEQQPQLLAIRQQLCKALGNRVLFKEPSHN